MRRLLDEGVLGEVILLKAQHESAICLGDGAPAWVRDPVPAGGGYMINSAVHSISLLRHLAGELSSVSAHGHWSPAADGVVGDTDVVVAARFEAGPVGSMTYTGRSRHVGERRLGGAVLGSRGLVEFDVLTGWVRSTADGVETAVRSATPSFGFAEEIDHFLTCVRSGREPLTGARDQLATIRTVGAIYASLQQGGAAVRVADITDPDPSRQ